MKYSCLKIVQPEQILVTTLLYLANSITTFCKAHETRYGRKLTQNEKGRMILILLRAFAKHVRQVRSAAPASYIPPDRYMPQLLEEVEGLMFSDDIENLFPYRHPASRVYSLFVDTKFIAITLSESINGEAAIVVGNALMVIEDECDLDNPTLLEEIILHLHLCLEELKFLMTPELFLLNLRSVYDLYIVEGEVQPN